MAIENHRIENMDTGNSMSLIPLDFEDDGQIPEKHLLNGENIPPSFMIDGVDSEIESLAFVMIDEDSPGKNTINWIMWNIDPLQKDLQSSTNITGKNSWQIRDYYGPTPLKRRQQYTFRLYGIPIQLNIDPNAYPEDALKIIEQASISESSVIATVQSKGEFAIE